MKVVALEKTTKTVTELAELAKEEPVVLTRAWPPVAAVRNLSGSDWESVSLASNPKFMALIEESHGPIEIREASAWKTSPRARPLDGHTPRTSKGHKKTTRARDRSVGHNRSVVAAPVNDLSRRAERIQAGRGPVSFSVLVGVPCCSEP